MVGDDIGPRNNVTAAESSRLYCLFAIGAIRVWLTGETLHIERRLSGASIEVPVRAIDSITVRLSLFWHRLTICLGDGTERSVGGLDGREAERVRDAVVATTAGVAKALSPQLKQFDEQVRQHLSGERYARYS
ncbi:MAG: hypothetical protein OXK21_00660, partial [Chloroflexota bacterium]|nr:hypothetical protein [Chloroflexota bacterium]